MMRFYRIKCPKMRGIGDFFIKKIYFSEEKSPELSQVGRPSTAHPCRGWRGGFENHKQRNLHRIVIIELIHSYMQIELARSLLTGARLRALIKTLF
jgi:hypothetical protein